LEGERATLLQAQRQLPADEQIQPFGTFQYTNLKKPPPAGGIDVNAANNAVNNDLTKTCRSLTVAHKECPSPGQGKSVTAPDFMRKTGWWHSISQGPD
jgi:hypothetical protein